MKFKRKILLASILLSLNYVGARAQEIFSIDLAKGQNIETRQTVTAGVPLQIIIKNKLLNQEYSISVQKKFQLLEELSLNASEGTINSLRLNEKCLITKKANALNKLDKEKMISKGVNNLKELLLLYEQKEATKEENKRDTICTKSDIANALFVIEKTRKRLLPQTLKKGEYIEVTISRKVEGDDDKEITWTSIYTTEKKGKWLTTYGFSFVPELISKSESFFSKQADTVFTITELNKRSRLNFVPSVFFTWFPYKDIEKDFSFSWTCGLGFDLEAPTAFLGGNLLYNQNIGISFGLAAHQQDFLNGRYEEGEIITENLGEEQLNEKLYSINPYISVIFRLGSSPFKGTNSANLNQEDN